MKADDGTLLLPHAIDFANLRKSRMSKAVALFCAVFVAGTCRAQPAAIPVEFPAEAVSMSAQALRSRVADKVFKVALASGVTWRVEYKGSGHFFVNTSTGFSSNGTWSVDGSKLCTETQRNPLACSDVRLLGDTLYVKRAAAPGEVIKFEAN